MTGWNQVKATAYIGGSECKYTTIRLKQEFNGHHSFDIGVYCPPLPGKSIWHNGRESVIAMQGQGVLVRLKHALSGDEALFRGIITEIGMDGEKGVSGTIHYRGSSPTILLESGKTMDSFTGYTLEAIAGEVVRNYGNGLEFENKPSFNGQIPYLQMHEESGYEFLRRIAFQYGQWFYYDGQKLHFGRSWKEKDRDEMVAYDVDLEEVSLGSRAAPFHYSRNDYMADGNRPLYADSDVARVEGVNSYLANAIKASEALYRCPTTLYNKAVLGHPVHMNRLLEFEKGRDTASLVWLKGKSRTCRVRIGEPIVVRIPASMCTFPDLGRYRVMSVMHEVDRNGAYSNTFEAIPASMERIPVHGVSIPEARPMLAKVASNEDPDKQGRVRVQFVWQEDQGKTTDWIRVRSLDAGSSGAAPKNRGFVFVPEKGDQVLVDFELGNPSRPYVSGSMFHQKNGKGGQANNHLKSIITRSGHTLEFNDDERGGSITLKDKSGNELIFKTAEGSIQITAPESMVFNAKNLFINVEDTIMQSSKQLKTAVGENMSLQIGNRLDASMAALDTTVQEDASMHVAGEYNQVSGGLNVASSGDATIQAGGKALVKGAREARISEG